MPAYMPGIVLSIRNMTVSKKVKREREIGYWIPLARIFHAIAYRSVISEKVLLIFKIKSYLMFVGLIKVGVLNIDIMQT